MKKYKTLDPTGFFWVVGTYVLYRSCVITIGRFLEEADSADRESFYGVCGVS